MTRLPRRAALLVALSLLISVVTAHAECAWVLWSHHELSVEGAPEVAQDKWLALDSRENQEQCVTRLEQLSVKAAGMRLIEDGETFRVWTSSNTKSGVSQIQRLQCLPDTVDPRGQKGNR